MLKLHKVAKHHTHKGEHVQIVNELSLSIKDSEFVALVGPSGCGKTTLLKMIAGLTPPSSGDIFLYDTKVVGPHKDRGVVFQQFTLFPWLKVKDNIAFGLHLQKMDKSKKHAIVEEYLELTGLKEFAHFYPKHLSGGQQQRVAIARTLANDPKILLMDEPFAALDSQTRGQMQEFLTQLWEKEKKMVLFVTHDIREAIFLADTVIVFSKRPLSIKQVFSVPFARPRHRDLKHTHAFVELEKEIQDVLESA